MDDPARRERALLIGAAPRAGWPHSLAASTPSPVPPAPPAPGGRRPQDALDRGGDLVDLTQAPPQHRNHDPVRVLTQHLVADLGRDAALIRRGAAIATPSMDPAARDPLSSPPRERRGSCPAVARSSPRSSAGACRPIRPASPRWPCGALEADPPRAAPARGRSRARRRWSVRSSRHSAERAAATRARAAARARREHDHLAQQVRLLVEDLLGGLSEAQA